MLVFECRRPKGNLCMNERYGICIFAGECKHQVKTIDDLTLYQKISKNA